MKNAMRPDRIVIALSRVKLVLLTGGGLLFVAAGLLLLLETAGILIDVKVVSVLAIGFFGLCALYGLVKLFDRSPGLVLDAEGIIDNSSGLAAGRVAWREIRDIRVVSESGQRFLAFVVADPAKYLAKGNLLRRLFVKMNYQSYGTPILISTHSLKVTFEDLEKLIHEFRRGYGNG